MNSHKIIFSCVGIALSLGALVPSSFVQAATSTSITDAQHRFCSQVIDHVNESEKRLSELYTNLETKREAREAKLAERQAERDAKLEQRRADADTRRAKGLKKLKDIGQTEEQNVAISEFQIAIDAAVTKRQADIQSANNAFRNGIKQALDTRKASVEKFSLAFASSVRMALEKAKTDCAAGVNAVTIRTTLRRNIQAARTQFQRDRAAADKMNVNIKKLIETRKQAYEKTKQEFRTALEKAKIDLRAALKEAKKNS